MPLSFFIFLIACILSFIFERHHIVGVWEKLRSSTNKDERRKHRIELYKALAIPVVTLIGTLVTGGEAIISGRETVKLHEAVASQDPMNQPIATVRATAVFVVRGTNLWSSIDPVNNNHIVTLSIANRDWMLKNNAFKLRLLCKSFEKYGGVDDREWVLEFGLDPMPSPAGVAWNLTTNDLVRSADDWDFFLLSAMFLKDKSEIIEGNLTLVVNTTEKHFIIPSQIAELQSGRYADFQLIGSIETNGVIITSGP